MIILASYIITLIALTIYSYCLIDPNITFFSNKLWTDFRDPLVYFGYYQRPSSWLVYLVLVLILFGFHFYFIKKYKNFPALKLGLIIGGVLLLSFPFLSHDFFNYLFDAKIFTFYHENPYLKRALDYPADDWLRFMHWTHRTYPYGPVFLVISFVPSFLSFGKFVLDFLLFKGLFVGCYLATVYYLNKMNHKWAVIFATHPLVLIEGLVSSHNDLVSVPLAVMGIYYLAKDKQVVSRFLFALSFGIKYITLPLVILLKKESKYWYINLLAFVGVLILLGYLTFKMEVQPWYFLALFVFLPYYEGLINKLHIFFAGLLFSYYPYIYFGGWDKAFKVDLKHNIILTFFVVNMVYLLYEVVKKYQKEGKKMFVMK